MKLIERKPVTYYNDNDSVLEKIAKIRGIPDIKEFLFPSKKWLHDPYLLKNIEVAANRVIQAIHKGEKIGISADCDVDGIFSTATMVRYLSQFNANMYVTYNERSRGHGIEYQLDMVEDDTSLMIILDSSTGSEDGCRELRKRGIDVIVLDHHSEKPNKYACIINPQLDDYPNKHLSGCGVVYKFIQVLDDTLQTGSTDYFLDIIACGMFADVMDTFDMENRYIMITGIQNINNAGLKAILESNDIKEYKVNSQTIGFTIAPMINGVTRMDNIKLALDLMLEDNYKKCLQLVEQMKELNEERKVIEKTLFNKYVQQINFDKKVLIAIDENASKNFNGLVANRISQEFKKPAIVLKSSGDELYGSFRSFGGLEMKSFLTKFKFVGYAKGHEEAGGIFIKKCHLERLEKAFENIELTEQAIEYDLEIDVNEIGEDMIDDVMYFDYMTGKGNPPIKFLVKNLVVDEDKKKRSVIIMGKNSDSVKIVCDDFAVVKFKTDSSWGSELRLFDYINVVGQLQLNEWEMWNKQVIVTKQIIADCYEKSIK